MKQILIIMLGVLTIVMSAVILIGCRKEPQVHTYRIITNNNDTLQVVARNFRTTGAGNTYFFGKDEMQFVADTKQIVII